MDSGSEKNNPVSRNLVNDNPGQAAPYRFEGGALILRLYIQPGAARTGWGGRHGGSELKLRVAAPPVEGKANAAVANLLSRILGVRRSQITILRGVRSRDKVLRVEGLSREETEERLAMYSPADSPQK